MFLGDCYDLYQYLYNYAGYTGIGCFKTTASISTKIFKLYGLYRYRIFRQFKSKHKIVRALEFPFWSMFLEDLQSTKIIKWTP